MLCLVERAAQLTGASVYALVAYHLLHHLLRDAIYDAEYRGVAFLCSALASTATIAIFLTGTRTKRVVLLFRRFNQNELGRRKVLCVENACWPLATVITLGDPSHPQTIKYLESRLSNKTRDKRLRFALGFTIFSILRTGMPDSIREGQILASVALVMFIIVLLGSVSIDLLRDVLFRDRRSLGIYDITSLNWYEESRRAKSAIIRGATLPRSIAVECAHSVWRDAVAELLPLADVVVADISTRSDPIRWEIDQSIEARGHDRVLLLANRRSPLHRAGLSMASELRSLACLESRSLSRSARIVDGLHDHVLIKYHVAKIISKGVTFATILAAFGFPFKTLVPVTSTRP